MLLALVIVVVVAAPGAGDPMTATMRRAVEDAVEPGSAVIVRERTAASDEDLTAVTASGNADAAVEVTDDGAQVRLRVYDARSRTTAVRALRFEGNELAADRARATGFVIASMVTEPEPPPSSPPPPQVDAPIAKPLAPSPPTVRSTFAADALATGTTGVTGDANAIGGELGLRAELGPRFGFRAAAGLGAGSAAGGVIMTRTVRLKLGAAYEVARWEGERTLTLRGRADVLAVLHEASLRDGSDASASRWVAALAAVLEGAWYVVPRAAIVVDAGVEVALGTTRVFVGNTERTTIPATRLVGAVGARFDF